KIKLRQFLGLPEEAELELVEPKLNPETVELEPMLAKARQNRVDLKGAQADQERATVLLKLEQLSQRLGIGLTWDLNRDNMQIGAGISNQTDNQKSTGEWKVSGNGKVFLNDPEKNEKHRRWGTVKLTFRWNFLDGNVRKERIKQAQLLTEQMGEELKKAEKNLAYEVQEAYYNYIHQLDQLHSTELQLKYNKTYFEATQAKLRVGLAAVKDVLDAQVLLNQAEVDYERVKTDVYLARMELLKVCGGLNSQI
ncbi:MAG TPA: TolC family protein, partial [Bacillota bacterium]|nr:TolC family protein [Bacillota bacterium]